MQAAADLAQVKLRPHIKAHKCGQIMHRQLAAGAIGITVAKLGEATAMADCGATDIFIAYPLIGQDKLTRLANLAKRVKVSVAVDDYFAARHMAEHFDPARPLDVLIEVDTGLKRCGVPPQAVYDLARALRELPSLCLKGIFTHAGHAYGASPDRVEAIGLEEAQVMADLARDLKRHGIVLEVVSTGSTPTARHNLKIPGITEIRPGNYVFYDAIQVGLGVVPLSACALSVQATVVSRPTDHRCVIDAGSKVLGLDKGAHGMSIVTGFGTILEHPELTIERLSEEHGVVVSAQAVPAIGTELKVIPNHACVAVNLADNLHLAESDEVWPVTARGRVD
jgi:D-serine deaminase-like pyridoxal phosphate-dependent protein